MTTLATVSTKHMRRPRAIRRPFSRPSYLRRFRYFIEHSDWDEMVLVQEGWIDKICVGLIVASVLYFLPILMRVFLG